MNKDDCEMFPDGAPQVSVCVTAYNHASYIRSALDSFLAQKTSFGIEILVHDDASTDGTTEILREYETQNPGKIRVFYEKENQFNKGTYKGGYTRGLLVPNARGRYIAVCEGDDCWTDDSKLQKQVDYLESHPGTVFSCHAARVVDGVSGEELGIMGMGKDERDLAPRDIIKHWQVPTASWVYRKGILDKLDDEWNFDMPVGDFPTVLYASLQGKVHYSPELMSLYRYQTPGSWTSRMADEQQAVEDCFRWINMYESIDIKTGRQFHNDLIDAAKNKAKVAVSAGKKDMIKTAFGQEAIKSFDLTDKIKVSIKLTLRKFGLGVQRSGFGANAKRRIIKR